MVRNKNKWDDRRIGLLGGLILPFITGYVYFLSKDWDASYFKYLEFLNYHGIQTQLIALSSIPNLLLFFLFINKDYYDSGRGVIFATALYLILVIILKIS